MMNSRQGEERERDIIWYRIIFCYLFVCFYLWISFFDSIRSYRSREKRRRTSNRFIYSM